MVDINLKARKYFVLIQKQRILNIVKGYILFQ